MARAASKLFNFCVDALNAAGAFQGGAGPEVCALLQKQLLSNPAYCQRISMPRVAGGCG